MKPPPRTKRATVAEVNPFWHLAHPMPRRPTRWQRIAWRRVHEQHCGCLPMPRELAAKLGKHRPRDLRSAARTKQIVRKLPSIG